MGRIRILPDAVANQIAAGEVVERPASVVKEMLENSLDAGATRIRVEVESGGRRLIRIVDDGCGMLRDDAMLAFERHATSKLQKLADLDAIATLGFRGEALPSIASVSRLLLETRSADETTGSRVELAGGKLLKCDEAALGPGTTITVRDLFYNVPARKKFLRTDQTELAHVAQLVTHYSLAHPDKSFELISDARVLLNVTPVDTMRDRVFQVFGTQILEDLIDIGDEERELEIPPRPGEEGETRVFLLRGFISRPQIQKMNRNSVFLFVNGRLIRDKLLLHALSGAYHNLMPPACYPFALLFLDMDAAEVDVNVHPSKTEVRFRHGSFVHDFVRDAIRARLMVSRPVPSMTQPVSPSGRPQLGADLPFSEFTQRIENMRFDMPASDMPNPPPEVAPGRPPDGPPSHHMPAEAMVTEDGLPLEVVKTFTPAEAGPGRLRVPDTHGGFPLDDIPIGMDALPEMRPIGQIHESFIIGAARDGLWIIDQHVAHERILFEKVLRQRASGLAERQQLLMPILLELTAAQQIEYARIADELNAAGFDSEPFGVRTIAVKAAPADVGAGEIERIIFEILDIAEKELRRASVEDIRRNIAASIACRAAIKINTRLDQAKMQWMLTTLAKCDFPMACPHGRPVALRYSMRDILRAFHRI